MSETNKINTYANIKQHSNADLRLPPRQIVADSDAQTSVAAQTVINFAFKVDMSNKSGFQIHVDGKLLREGASNDYTFTNIQADNTSSQVTLTFPLLAGMNIIPQKLGVDKEISPSLANLQAELQRRKVYANYITNSTFEYSDTLGYALYNDGSAIPVNGVGGVVNANVTFAISDVNPLRGAKSALLSKDAANRQGHGVANDFQIDLADRNKALMIRFDAEGSANYQAGFAKIYVYDKLNNTLISAIPLDVPSQGQALAYFAATDSTQYRLIVHIASADATAWSLKIDDVQVGQPDLIFGYPGSDWTAYDLTISAMTTPPTKGTVVRDEARWRRVGDSMEIEYNYRQTGAGSAGSGAYIFRLPPGYEIDTAKLSLDGNIGTQAYCGSGLAANSDGPGPSIVMTYMAAFDSTGLRMFFHNEVTSANTIDAITDAVLGLSDATIRYTFFARVPIVNWDSSIQLASSTVEYAYNTATADSDDLVSFGYGPGGVAIGSYTTAERTKRIRFPNPVSQTDHVFAEVFENGNWIRLADHELNPVKQGALRYGIRVTPVAGSFTDYDVFFGGGGGEAGGSYAGAGLAWSGYTSLKWRLVKSQNALGVEADSVGSRLIGSAYLDIGTTYSTASAPLAPFAASASASPVVELNPGPGAIQTTAVTRPRFTVNGLPSGIYRVTINTTGDAGSSNASLAINDGITTSGYVGFDGSSNREVSVIGYFRYSGMGNRTFELWGANSGSTTTIYANSGVSPGWIMGFFIERVGN